MLRRLIPVLLGVALVAAACSGGSESAESDVATLEATDSVVVAADADEPTETDDEEQLLAFTACMRDEGVDIGDPTVDSDGNVRLGGNANVGEIDQNALAAAADVCGDLLDGVTLGFTDADQTELQDTLVDFAGCMRDNGYDMDDPDLSNFGAPGGGSEDDGAPATGRGPFGDIDQDDPAFQAAFDACDDLLAGVQRGVGTASDG